MPRVKGGYVTRRRRKKVLKLAKGYYGSKHTLYKTANEQVMRSMAYAYRDRKQRKRNFRKLWISRINAACKLNDCQYSKFINGLALLNIQVNRKMLADLAVTDSKAFAELVVMAKKALENKKIAEKPVYIDIHEYRNQFVKNAPKAVVKKEVKEEPKKVAKAEVKPAVKAEVKKEVKTEVKPEVKAEVKKEVKAEVKKEAKVEVKAEAITDLSKLSLADLKALAKERGLKGYSTLKKDELLNLLK